MRILSRLFTWLVFAGALSAPILVSGCAARASVGYRYYDADYNDYHTWNDSEAVYYTQWEHDTHRDHRDFQKRSKDEQQQYWHWRHDHDRH